ncbi:MAG: RdgB/HAM1 family non-canonical purine NTP pyrophosphatase [Acidobacteria bacterium]|nr:RdgB/HAM1 family non-canonical purine NTP pyrophosphatase [Acidobacteriota bacterium]
MLLYCATSNPGKLREFRDAAGRLAPGEFVFEPLPHLDEIPPAEETGGAFEENATRKALHYSRFTGSSVFADDSGLEVAALGGAPGVHSARFAGPGASSAANNRLLLEKLAGVNDRGARFVCVIALALRGEILGTFHGAVEGEILEEPRGSGGFGYDPLFYYPPLGCTFGEASEEQKLSVSHRGAALRRMIEALPTLRQSKK